MQEEEDCTEKSSQNKNQKYNQQHVHTGDLNRNLFESSILESPPLRSPSKIYTNTHNNFDLKGSMVS